jgi:hypothetical protein
MIKRADKTLLSVQDCAVMDRSQGYRLRSTASAVVELASTMRMFYTPSIGSPDVLFTVLLASAREAYAVTTASAARGERDGWATGLLAEIYLAGSLLFGTPARHLPGK